MATDLATINGPVAIRQRVSAGNNFGGVAPENTGVALVPTFADSIYKFTAGTDGGLFDFWGGPYSFRKCNALYLFDIELILDAGTAWSISSEDPDGFAITIASGTGASYFAGIHNAPLPYPILPNGLVKLVTTGGAGGAKTARLKLGHFVP